MATEIAKLHSYTSPNGKFGFHVPTCCGSTEMPNDWESSWTQFFGKHRLQAILNDDRRNNGPDSEMEELGKQCVEQVVPRLLDALEENGNSIKPVLLHGDLCVLFKQDSNVDGAVMQERTAIPENLSYMILRHSSDTMSMRLEYKR